MSSVCVNVCVVSECPPSVLCVGVCKRSCANVCAYIIGTSVGIGVRLQSVCHAYFRAHRFVFFDQIVFIHVILFIVIDWSDLTVVIVVLFFSQ